MAKRLFDLLGAGFALLLLWPLFLLIALLIAADSRGGVFYLQERIGKNGRPFRLYKFRTMHTGADRQGLLTVGHKDNRTTSAGRFLRRYKLDELPQLINVLRGDMSFVGPRPEVAKYVAMYTENQRKVLEVKPGITDPASLAYFEENELLAGSPNPEATYIQEIMPAKLAMNLEYLRHRTFFSDLKIILKTLGRIFN